MTVPAGVSLEAALGEEAISMEDFSENIQPEKTAREELRGYQGRFAHIGETSKPKQDAPSVPTIEPVVQEKVVEDVHVHSRELVSATDYDELINWSSRLAKETALYHRAFSMAGARSVVNVGCGSGRRAIMFAEWGLDVLGIEANPILLERARELAAEANPEIIQSRGSVGFVSGRLGAISLAVGPEKVDAIVCVGDVLPRVESLTQLRHVLIDFSDALNPSGVLVLEIINHTRFMQQRLRATAPAVFDTVEGTKVFLRVMDYPAASTVVDTDLLSLTRDSDGEWSVSSERTQNLFISSTGITRELFDAGFDVLEVSGDYNGKELDQFKDESIIIIARRKRHRPSSIR
ncbi:MAG: class I SAM-dependent methyltransferase [Actinobacteria bacterium]|nr:class I SAM-dependent methyltransferase [Actinomycetota bacterium]